jgi:hypothetical protein
MERRRQRSHRPKTAPPFMAPFSAPLQRMENPMNGQRSCASTSFRRQVSILEFWCLASLQSSQIRVYCLGQTGKSSPKQATFGNHKKSSRTFWSKPAPSRHGPEHCVDIVGGRDKVASDDAFAIGTTEAGDGPVSRFDPHDRRNGALVRRDEPDYARAQGGFAVRERTIACEAPAVGRKMKFASRFRMPGNSARIALERGGWRPFT